jgi:hypothetical protein
MFINSNKIQDIIFGTAHKSEIPSIAVANNMIRRVTSFKLLDVTIITRTGLPRVQHLTAIMLEGQQTLALCAIVEAGISAQHRNDHVNLFSNRLLHMPARSGNPAWLSVRNGGSIQFSDELLAYYHYRITGSSDNEPQCATLNIEPTRVRLDGQERERTLLEPGSCLHRMLSPARPDDVTVWLRQAIEVSTSQGRTVRNEQSFLPNFRRNYL